MDNKFQLKYKRCMSMKTWIWVWKLGETCAKRDKLIGQNEFLSWDGANDCVKDKIIRNYAIQLMGIDTKEPKPSQPKVNHYEYMKQKVKSKDAK